MNTSLWDSLLQPAVAIVPSSHDGDTRLHAMVSYGYEGDGAVETELQKADIRMINAQNCLGWTPLHCAAASCYYNGVQALLQAGADPFLRTNEPAGCNALHLAASSGEGCSDIIRLLLQSAAAARTSTAGTNEIPPAVRLHLDPLVQLLTALDGRGASALAIAASRANPESKDGAAAVQCIEAICEHMPGLQLR